MTLCLYSRECPSSDALWMDVHTPQIMLRQVWQLWCSQSTKIITWKLQAHLMRSTPKIEKTKISAGCSEETWSTFYQRWIMFERSTSATGAVWVEQLLHCCDEYLGDSILKGHPDAVKSSEENLIMAIKQMAILCRADLLGIRQDHSENTRAFHAKVRGKVSTCSYSIECTGATCSQGIDFINIMVKDVVISGRRYWKRCTSMA